MFNIVREIGHRILLPSLVVTPHGGCPECPSMWDKVTPASLFLLHLVWPATEENQVDFGYPLLLNYRPSRDSKYNPRWVWSLKIACIVGFWRSSSMRFWYFCIIFLRACEQVLRALLLSLLRELWGKFSSLFCTPSIFILFSWYSLDCLWPWT